MKRKKKNYYLYLLILVVDITFGQTYPSWRVELVAHLKPDTYFSGCWGWYDSIKNREYAISGSHKGTYFVDITDPSSVYIADSVIDIPINTWREIKNYKNYCYIISDDYFNTFQIVDMSYLPDSVYVLASPHKGLLRQGHTLWVDRHYLYVGGPRDSLGHLHSMGVFNLHPDPANPTFLRWLDQDFPNIFYVHDMYVRNDTIFASAANQGLQVFKYDSIQNKFVFISSLTNYLEAGYNHSSALTQDGKTLVFMDEVPSGLSIKVADVSNINNIQVCSYIKPYNYGGFIAHNPFILGNKFLVASCYQDGTLIYDISDPYNPVLKGYFDTYPQGGANVGIYSSNTYDGNWGSYPFFPSGLIFSNDMTNGIFILKADSALSVDENNYSYQTIIFPNPVQKEIHIYTNFPNSVLIQLLDCTGKVLLDKFINKLNPQQAITLSLPDIEDGVYFLQLSSKSEYKITKKIIIKH